jgi:hypothetical protein
LHRRTAAALHQRLAELTALVEGEGGGEADHGAVHLRARLEL